MGRARLETVFLHHFASGQVDLLSDEEVLLVSVPFKVVELIQHIDEVLRVSEAVRRVLLQDAFGLQDWHLQTVPFLGFDGEVLLHSQRNGITRLQLKVWLCLLFRDLVGHITQTELLFSDGPRLLYIDPLPLFGQNLVLDKV